MSGFYISFEDFMNNFSEYMNDFMFNLSYLCSYVIIIFLIPLMKQTEADNF